jgi:hypothetical protein
LSRAFSASSPCSGLPRAAVAGGSLRPGLPGPGPLGLEHLGRDESRAVQKRSPIRSLPRLESSPILTDHAQGRPSSPLRRDARRSRRAAPAFRDLTEGGTDRRCEDGNRPRPVPSHRCGRTGRSNLRRMRPRQSERTPSGLVGCNGTAGSAQLKVRDTSDDLRFLIWEVPNRKSKLVNRIS